MSLLEEPGDHWPVRDKIGGPMYGGEPVHTISTGAYLSELRLMWTFECSLSSTQDRSVLESANNVTYHRWPGDLIDKSEHVDSLEQFVLDLPRLCQNQVLPIAS